MKHNVFSCDSSVDITFIPFMPATTQDNVELRIQLKTAKSGALLDTMVLVDGKEIHSVEKQPVEKFYFFNNFSYYTEGTHSLLVRFRESGQDEFEETKLSFCIEKERKPLLSGGFIMLGPPNDRKPCSPFTEATKQMSEKDWERYIGEMAKLDIRFIIIAVTVQLRTMKGENTAHYDSNLYPHSDILAKDPIRAILRAAEANGQYVFIGLGHTYCGTLPNTTDVMDELYAIYGDSPAFYGWYESEEINMRQNNDKLYERWQHLRDHALSLSPVKPFLVSPYADGENVYDKTGGIHPEFLKRLEAGEASFDIIAPQDMVGHTVEGGRLTVKESGEMYHHLSKSCSIAKKHLWANCEAFDFNESLQLVPRFNGGGMNGENGYIQQIEAVHPYVEKIGTFMLNGFFSPEGFEPMLGGKRAVEQCECYRSYKNSLK